VGSLGVPQLVAPGVYDARYSAPESGRSGVEAHLVVKTRQAPVSIHRCAVVPLELPTAVAVALDRPEHVAGSREPVLVSVDLTYPGKRRPQAVPLRLEADLGQVSALRKTEAGRYTATWELPDKYDGQGDASIEVIAQGAGLNALAALKLTPGHIKRVDVTTQHSYLRADGRSTTTVTARAYDAYGNFVPTANLVTESGGELGEFASASDGVFVGTYIAPHSYRQTQDTVVVRDQNTEIEGAASIFLGPPRDAIALGGRVSLTSNFSDVTAPGFLADATLALPLARDRLSVALEGGYFLGSHDQLLSPGVEGRLSVSAVPLLARVTYLGRREPFSIYAGIGGGVIVANTEVRSVTDGVIEKRSSAPAAFSGVVGSEVGSGSIRLVAELAYWSATVESGYFDGPIGGLSLSVGYRFGL
jgi:hypothetical protein